MKIVFLSENKTEIASCGAEWGLSIYIDTGEKKLLFDAGASNLFYDTARKRRVDLESVDACIVSHGHYDHTTGIPEFCKINSQAPIYIHKNAIIETYGTTKGEIEKYNCGVPWNDKEKQEVLSRAILTDEPMWLSDDIVVSGTIPDIPEFKPVEKFYVRKIDGSLEPDTMDHEQFLAIRNGDKGIYVFSGCSHKGIVAAIEYAKKLFPGEKIGGIIAGMHLFSASDEQIVAVMDRIEKENPDIIIPTHCTGIYPSMEMAKRFGAKCLIGSNGRSYNL